MERAPPRPSIAFPLATALSFGNGPFALHYPLLFVIPSEARNLQFSSLTSAANESETADSSLRSECSPRADPADKDTHLIIIDEMNSAFPQDAQLTV
jgi:hypothetical protein